MKVFSQGLVLAWLCCHLSLAQASSQNELLTAGQDAYRQGNYSQAITHWQEALTSSDLSLYRQIDLFLRLAVSYQMQGDYQQAYKHLQQAQPLVEADGSVGQQKLFYSYLGDLLLALQQPYVAKTWLEKGLTIKSPNPQPRVDAHVLNNLGNALSITGELSDALARYRQATQLAESTGDRLLHIQTLSNQARTHLALKQSNEAAVYIGEAAGMSHYLPDLRAQAFYLLNLGEMSLQLHQQTERTNALQMAFRLLEQARQIAKQVEDDGLRSQVKTYLAIAHKQGGEYGEALNLIRDAVFLSQQEPALFYYAEWQRGQIFEARGNIVAAESSYRKAIEHLYPIQLSLSTGQRNALDVFKERVRPVYFSLASLLLRKAEKVGAAQQQQSLLQEARDTIERLRTAELQDYYQDECLDIAAATRLDKLDPHTAVLYPISLKDRLVLLYSIEGHLQALSMPIGADEFTQTILDFQENLQVRSRWSLLRQARNLHKWLIEPFQAELERNHIDTLVLVPDSLLRMIPLAALHSGKHFLIEDFALVTTPSLDLTDPKSLPRGDISVLLSGLSEAVQGFTSLPNVPAELEGIKTLFQQRDVLLDKTFLLGRVNQALVSNPYEIVHIASHGQFDRDPAQTFVLTYDDKLGMEHLKQLLGRYRKQPVELLTLSACQTAVGDERAALGLAGVAIKAGARSALASLWFVNDEATAQLLTRFYGNLQNPALSKAEALQQAQKSLIDERRFRHPAYWAPFLLIGNWL